MRIGEYLRTEREKRGLSYLDVENKIKIRTKYLAALESENFQEIPGKVYVLGFLRTYAHYLGLNPDQIIASYKSQTSSDDQEITFSTTIEPKSNFLRLALDLKSYKFIYLGTSGIILVCLISLLIYGTVRLNKTKYQSQHLSSSVQVNQGSRSPERVEVKLIGKEKCWVLAKVDESEQFSGLLHPGEIKTFQAKEVIWLKLGNAGGVEIYQNDRKIPPLGQHGEVIVQEFRKSVEVERQ